MRTESLSDQLRRARRRRFTGRRTEIDELRAALTVEAPPFSVMFVHGPGGIGKTSLLDVFCDEATGLGATVARIDACRITPTPSGVLAALSTALGAGDLDDPIAALSQVPRPLLLVDGYELLEGIDPWFREQFLTSLPSGALVVVAGRRRPVAPWLADPAWRDLLHVVRLDNLPAQDALDYLVVEDVPAALRERLVALSHGHPFTLSLLVDSLYRRGYPADAVPRRLEDVPVVLNALLSHVIDAVPSPAHQIALDVAAHARSTTEDLLRSVLGPDGSSGLFGWLRTLSFMEEGPFGLYPSALARDVLDADQRWRDGDGYADLHRRVRRYLVDNVRRTADERATQRRIADAIFVARSHPLLASTMRWPDGRIPYLDAVQPHDRPVLLAMTEERHGPQQAAMLDHWLERQPGAFKVIRGEDGEPRSFGGFLALHECSAGDIAADPGARSMWEFAQRAGPPRPGEAVMAWRFLLDDSPTGLSTLGFTLAAMARVEAGLSRSRWSWDLVGVSDSKPMCRSIMDYLDFSRVPAADYDIDARTFAVYAHDWRVVGIDEWLELTTARELGGPVEPSGALPGHVLSEADFAAAVRDALRDLHLTGRLALNPLLRSPVVRMRSRTQPPEAALREVLLAAVEMLREDPRKLVLHQVAVRAFVQPDPTQEQAAAALKLPLSTYRRHRDRAVQRITELLWQQEFDGDPTPQT
ncbi:AAA family ATPase [Pseudonocardia sp. TRM90224]|uniref:AAA family ATPase n=1 Tax=Pseudonocardia sp. TRM90224 TaxID=2812678 RepID=UPI001E3CED5A|nr:AAA family ATPase [Pseudonocardia sp. TRM90224]